MARKNGNLSHTKKASRPTDRPRNAFPPTCRPINEKGAKVMLIEQGLVHQKTVPCVGQEESSKIGVDSESHGDREGVSFHAPVSGGHLMAASYGDSNDYCQPCVAEVLILRDSFNACSCVLGDSCKGCFLACGFETRRHHHRCRHDQ